MQIQSQDHLWANKYLKNNDVERIGEAVRIAEKKTSGEIVPMVVLSSSPVGHVPMLVTLFASVIFLLIGNWAHFGFYFPNWIWSLLILLPGFYFIGSLMKRNLTVQRFLTNDQDESDNVFRRAQLEFYQQKLQKTKDRTGILIFVSLMERQVIVLADKGISERLPQSTWDEVVQLIIQGKKSGNLADGMIAGIQKCGELLTEKFPVQSHDQNEIGNQLILKK